MKRGALWICLATAFVVGVVGLLGTCIRKIRAGSPATEGETQTCANQMSGERSEKDQGVPARKVAGPNPSTVAGVGSAYMGGCGARAVFSPGNHVMPGSLYAATVGHVESDQPPTFHLLPVRHAANERPWTGLSGRDCGAGYGLLQMPQPEQQNPLAGAVLEQRDKSGSRPLEIKPAGSAVGVSPRADPSEPDIKRMPIRKLLDAIREVESGGDDRAVGDGGRSRGPYQCGRAAWADGGGDPDDYDRLVWNRAACERVMVGYWRRYGATTDEERCRLWNGGPRWREKPQTAAYWQRIKGNM